MKLLLNYANQRFAELQRRNSESGLAVAGFDRAVSFGPGDIDAEFAARNRGILQQKRGNGYWLWKPYFIVRTLESLAPGNWLFYCDAGAHFVAPIEPLLDVSRHDCQDVIVFELPYPERRWTKRDAFVLLDCDRPEFAEEERLLTDRPNQCGLPNYRGFQEHRHDQSLLSLLTKKQGLVAYRDPSQQGTRDAKRYANSPYGQLIEHTRLGRAPLTQRVWRKVRKIARRWSAWWLGDQAPPRDRQRAA
jgi:hypothetical protein